jgi:hypothetical protein
MEKDKNKHVTELVKRSSEIEELLRGNVFANMKGSDAL